MTDHDPRRQELLDRVRTMTRGPIAPRGRRQALAIGYLAAVGVAAVGPLLPSRIGILITGAGVVAAMVLLGLLRRATRWLADAPSEALDDLFRRLQGQSYVAAYQLLGALVVLVGAGLLLVGGWPDRGGVARAPLEAAGWLLLGVALAAPVVVTALTLPDVEPDPDGEAAPGRARSGGGPAAAR